MGATRPFERSGPKPRCAYPDRFPAGACARSLLAMVPALPRRPGDAPVYELTVPRSYAEFARDWLEDAALEYAVTGDSP